MQKRNKKILSVCSLASLVISSSVVSTGVKAASSQPSSTRIYGSDRYETAVQVSKAGWTSSDYVVIANGQGYADALCADPLAKAKNAPVLLTQSDSLSSSTIAEIKRLNAKHVIIVGGTGVVKANIENTIKSQTGADITRYGGTDRYETSTKIAAAIGTTSKVVLASGQGYADALSAAPAASIEGIPIILTQANSLPQTSANYIKANSGITKTYVIGGTASVSDSVLSQVPGGQRFGGADRFATNKAVIEGLSSDFNFNTIYAALGVGPNGNEFADALTGAALAAKNKNALVITSNPLSSYTTQLLADKLTTSSTITVLGGTANISDSIVSQLKSAVTNTAISGGGGGSSINYTNITSTLKNEPTTILGGVYASYKDKVNNGTLKNDYFTIDSNSDDDSNYVNVDLSQKSNEITDIQDIFTKAKSKYAINSDGKINNLYQFNKDITNINDKLKVHFGNVTLNDSSVLTFLGSLNSQYFNTDGTLNAGKIQAVIESHPNDMNDAYTTFQKDVNNQIDKYFQKNSTGYKLSEKNPKLVYNGVQVTKILKGSTKLEVFNASEYNPQAVKELVDNLVLPSYNNDNYFVDTYQLYLGTEYVNVEINSASAN